MYTIQPITPEEVWPIRKLVMWPNKPVEYVILDNDSEGLHFGLIINDQIVSIISVFIDSNKAQFRKFATLENHQGNGYGSKLLIFIIEHIQSMGIKKIWCNARANKTIFYKKFGLNKTKHTFQKGGINYIIMEKNF